LATRWLCALASESVNAKGAEEADPVSSIAIKSSSITGATCQRRGPLAMPLIVLTCIAFVGSVFSIWTHQQLLDTDNFASAVDPLANNPAVVDVVGANGAQQSATGSGSSSTGHNGARYGKSV
jgi:hypothetical protein